MNFHITILTLCTIIATTSAAPNPSPIDADTADVIALNQNLACSSGSCNTTIAGTNGTSIDSSAYSSMAWGLQDSWSPFTFLAAGGLALSAGML